MKQQYYFKSDKQNYIVRKNKDLIKYIRNTSKKGIEFEINLNEMQQLIDYVGFWYELKYSNEYLSKENINDKDTIYDIKKLYNSLFNMKSFLQNERISNFLSCNYRGRYDYIGIDNREYIYLESGKKDDNESIFIDKINGNVYNNKLKPLLNSSGEHLDIISFNNQELGILNEEVNLILLNRSYDIELRNKLLNLVIYKILYSKESTMDINYKRAICYINEITKIFPDLNIEKDTLDNYRFVKVKR